MPDDPYFLYHYARYAAKNGYMNEFLNKLRECIYKDPKYLIMADAEDMFFDVKEKIKGLAKCLRDEKKQAVENLSKEIVSLEAEAKTEGIKELPFLKEQRTEIIKLSARNSYFDFLKAEEIAQNVCGKILSLIRDKLKREEKGKDFPVWKYYIISVLTVLIATSFEPPESGGETFWVIFFLLIAPVTVFLGGILSILHILGGDIPDWTTEVAIVFLSGSILIILWSVLDNRRETNRLNSVRNKLKKIEERMPAEFVEKEQKNKNK